MTKSSVSYPVPVKPVEPIVEWVNYDPNNQHTRFVCGDIEQVKDLLNYQLTLEEELEKSIVTIKAINER